MINSEEVAVPACATSEKPINCSTDVWEERNQNRAVTDSVAAALKEDGVIIDHGL